MAIIGIVLYGGAALLNANHLQRRAAQQPFGSSRDTAVALTDGLRWVSHGLGLTAPGRWVDRLRGTSVRSSPGLTALAPRVPGATATASGLLPSASTTPISSTVAAPVITAASKTPVRAPGKRPALPDGVGAAAAAEPPPSTTDSATGTTSSASGTGTRGASADGAATTKPATSAAATVPAVPRLTLRNPTVDDPLRVYVGGDSLSQGVGTSLSRVASAFGTMKVLEHGVISSGLTRPDYYDWPAELGRALASGQPEAYVLMFGANDPQTIETPTGNVNVGDPRWEEAYRARVALVMGALSATRPVIWIGLPAVGRNDLEPQMQLLTRIYSEEAAQFPNVRYIDVRAMIGPVYTPYIDDGNGKQVLVRAQDKVHFTPAGYDMLAKAAADQITALIAK